MPRVGGARLHPSTGTGGSPKVEHGLLGAAKYAWNLRITVASIKASAH